MGILWNDRTMKTASLKKPGRWYVWILLLLLAVLFFILLRTPAAGHNQNSQNSSSADITNTSSEGTAGLEPTQPQISVPVDPTPTPPTTTLPVQDPNPSYPRLCPQYLRFSESGGSCQYPPCKPAVPSSQPSADVVMCVYD